MDTQAPGATSIKYNSGSNSCSWKNNYNLTLSSSDNVGIAYYEIDWTGDGNANTTTSSNFVPWSGYTSCNNRFRAVDHAGNRGPWTSSQHIHQDTTAPTCGGWSGGSTSWTGGNRTIYVGCNDTGGSGCAASSFSQTFTSNVKDTTSTIVIRDNAGNTAVCSSAVSVYVGKTSNIYYRVKNGPSSNTNVSNVGAAFSDEIRTNGGFAGRVGYSSPINQIIISANSPNISGNVNYQVYQQSFATNNNPNGIGDNTLFGRDDKRIESIRIWLTGDMANAFNIWYRVYIQTYGWLAVTSNGTWTGSTGISKNMEAIEIKILPRTEGSGSWNNAGNNCSTAAFTLITGDNYTTANYHKVSCG